MATTAELDKTHALMAPGQASQGVGKGLELYLNSEAAKKVWEESDRVLGFPFSDLALYGKVNGVVLEGAAAKAEITKTENAQPAVIVTSLAALAALEEHSLLGEKRPFWNTGHSVGLIVAMVTSGALDKEGAVKLGDARRKAFKYAIENSPPSGFLAVQHDKPEVVNQYVEDLTTKYPLRICLENYDNQIVLGGEIKELEAAMEYVRGIDSKIATTFARPLVEAAYHHPDFMVLAVPIFGEEVDKIDMQAPTNGVVVAGSMVEDDGTVRVLETVADLKTALKRQPDHPERWRQVIRFLVSQGVVKMIELNESPSLASWSKRMFGGDRESLDLPGVLNSEEKPIAIAWTWKAASSPVKVESHELENGVMEEMNEEVEGLLKQYGEVDDMEEFLQLPQPQTFGGMLLWYQKWMATRRFMKIEDVKPDSDFVKDLEGDSLDYEVLRADVEGVYQNPVNVEEAENNTTPRLCAIATWNKKNRLKAS